MTGEVRFNGRPVWAEVRLGALEHNLRAIQRHIRRRSRPRRVLAVVKADAYGHGAVDVAKTLAKAGADCFGVTCTAEGAELREAGIEQPILVLGGFWPGEERQVLRYRLTPAITQLEQLRHLECAVAALLSSPPACRSEPGLRRAGGQRRNGRARLRPSRNRDFGGQVGFHLKVDTGMNRLGVLPQELERFVGMLADCHHLRLEGTFTHFASAEVFSSEQTEQQAKLFEDALERLRHARISPGIVHLANSAGAAARPATWADMVRPGALLYGYHPSYEPADRRAEMAAKLPLQPVLSLRARILLLKDVRAGQGVGYNARFVTKRPSRIAVIAAGYADGVARRLTNRSPACSCQAQVMIHGRRVPLVGTISMDLAMADVTELEEVRVGDIATFFGPDGGAALSAADVARELDTVTSDLLCAVGKRVPRFFLR